MANVAEIILNNRATIFDLYARFDEEALEADAARRVRLEAARAHFEEGLARLGLTSSLIRMDEDEDPLTNMVLQPHLPEPIPKAVAVRPLMELVNDAKYTNRYRDEEPAEEQDATGETKPEEIEAPSGQREESEVRPGDSGGNDLAGQRDSVPMGSETETPGDVAGSGSDAPEPPGGTAQTPQPEVEWECSVCDYRGKFRASSKCKKCMNAYQANYARRKRAETSSINPTRPDPAKTTPEDRRPHLVSRETKININPTGPTPKFQPADPSNIFDRMKASSEAEETGKRLFEKEGRFDIYLDRTTDEYLVVAINAPLPHPLPKPVARWLKKNNGVWDRVTLTSAMHPVYANNAQTERAAK
jgi:hypothetical protein